MLNDGELKEMLRCGVANGLTPDRPLMQMIAEILKSRADILIAKQAFWDIYFADPASAAKIAARANNRLI